LDGCRLVALFPLGLGNAPPRGPAAGVMEAIKGNIGAIPLFPAGAAFLLSLRFFPQHARRSKNGARGSLGERMIYRCEVTRFTRALLPTILAKTNSPAT